MGKIPIYEKRERSWLYKFLDMGIHENEYVYSVKVGERECLHDSAKSCACMSGMILCSGMGICVQCGDLVKSHEPEKKQL